MKFRTINDVETHYKQGRLEKLNLNHLHNLKSICEAYSHNLEYKTMCIQIKSTCESEIIRRTGWGITTYLNVEQVFNSGNLHQYNEEYLKDFFKICVNLDTNISTGKNFSRHKADFIAHAILGELTKLQNETLEDQMYDLNGVVGILSKSSEAQKQLAETSSIESKQLTTLTSTLVGETVILRQVAETQTHFSKSMADDSTVIKKLTRVLVALTIVLTLQTVILIALAVTDFVEKYYFHHS